MAVMITPSHTRCLRMRLSRAIPANLPRGPYLTVATSGRPLGFRQWTGKIRPWPEFFRMWTDSIAFGRLFPGRGRTFPAMACFSFHGRIFRPRPDFSVHGRISWTDGRTLILARKRIPAMTGFFPATAGIIPTMAGTFPSTAGILGRTDGLRFWPGNEIRPWPDFPRPRPDLFRHGRNSQSGFRPTAGFLPATAGLFPPTGGFLPSTSGDGRTDGFSNPPLSRSVGYAGYAGYGTTESDFGPLLH